MDNPRRKNLRPDERRNQLLDCAQHLFATKGYEGTTISEIIEAAGVSKGGFYHHFDCKDAMLAALATRMANLALKRIDPILEDPALDPFARLNDVLRELRAQKTDIDPELSRAFEAVFQPANVVLYDRIRRAVTNEVAPIITRLVEEGVADGVFDVPDPEICVELILHLNSAAYDAIAAVFAARGQPECKPAIDRLYRVMRMQGIAVDRLLGLPDGSITWIDDGSLEKALHV